MKFTTALVPLAAILVASVTSVPMRREVDPNLVPDLGFHAGVNPTGTGDCDGAVNGADGRPIKVPCACPPDRNTFLQALNTNVAAGHAVNNPPIAVTFPTDSSKAAKSARITAALITLQNLHGPGQGCPAASTTLLAQQAAVNAAPAKRAGGADIARLAPDLGFHAGVNPHRHGRLRWPVNGPNGQPIKIPCACPPDRATFLQHLSADVEAGHAVNNPSIAVSFPADDSVPSRLARIDAALITLQNLNGPGSGCPAVSTTLLAQRRALQG